DGVLPARRTPVLDVGLATLRSSCPQGLVSGRAQAFRLRRVRREGWRSSCPARRASERLRRPLSRSRRAGARTIHSRAGATAAPSGRATSLPFGRSRRVYAEATGGLPA